MIISASTVKDSRENVEKFVRRNLLGGIDHLVVFLDERMPDVEEYLDDHADATLVRAYDDWWAGQARGGLKGRQILNAGVLSRLVAGFAWAEWVFHLDGDEVARLDRSVLGRLGAETRAVRLTCLEAVSSLRPDGDPTLFKQVPDEHVLTLLASLGVIREAKERAYFRGPTTGKPGVRPADDLVLGLHHVLDLGTGERVPAVEDPALTFLHYESVSSQEFARKWSALVTSGGEAGKVSGRPLIAGAVSAMLSLDVSDDVRARWFDRLFERVALDDVETLARLRLLVEIDPDAGDRPATTTTAHDVAQLRTLLDRAHDVPKQQFRPRAANSQAPKTLARLRRGV